MTYIPTFEERPVSRSAMLAQAICMLTKLSRVSETHHIPDALHAMAERRQPTQSEAEELDGWYKQAFGDYTKHPDYGKDH